MKAVKIFASAVLLATLAFSLGYTVADNLIGRSLSELVLKEDCERVGHVN